MPEPKQPCPSCSQQPRSVSMKTVRHMTELATEFPGGRAWFCGTPTCAVVYFGGGDRRIEKRGVRVAVFQKETDPTRPVCYCFEHSVADVVDAHQDDGTNRIVDEITDACRRGLDRCEETNPQGRCCLGNARGLVRGGVAPKCCEGPS